MSLLVAKIDNIIDQLAMSRMASFYPHYIAQKIGTSDQEIFQYLRELVLNNKLEMKWEVVCSTSGCMHSLGYYDDYKDVLGKQLICSVCGKEVDVTEDNIFPVFSFVKEYRNERKKYLLGGIKKKRLMTNPFLVLQAHR